MTETGQRVVVVDLRIPFLRLVLFFVKAAFAAIPAAIIVGLLLMLVTALFAGLAGDAGAISRADTPLASAAPGGAGPHARPASW